MLRCFAILCDMTTPESSKGNRGPNKWRSTRAAIVLEIQIRDFARNGHFADTEPDSTQLKSNFEETGILQETELDSREFGPTLKKQTFCKLAASFAATNCKLHEDRSNVEETATKHRKIKHC